MDSSPVQQYDTYVSAISWLRPVSSAFLLARKCNLAEIMLITLIMRHVRIHELQLSGPTVRCLHITLLHLNDVKVDNNTTANVQI